VPRLTRERVVRAPPERVWSLLTDPAERARWLRSMKEEPATEPMRVGARVKSRRTAPGSRSTYESTVRTLEPPRLLAMEIRRNGEPAGTGGYELHKHADGTRVVAFAEYELKGAQKLLGPVVHAGLVKELDADLAGLAARAENDTGR
jgi:uncharacterized protein YndB with AHSA1/START domain